MTKKEPYVNAAFAYNRLAKDKLLAYWWITSLA